MSDLILQTKDVVVAFDGNKVLSGASIVVKRGEIVGIMGANGVGKSTVLKSIFGLVPMFSGQIIVNGSDIHPVPYRMIRQGVAYVPQGKQLFKALSVQENLELGGAAACTRQELAKRVEEGLEIFPDLRDKLKEKAGSLSGGQQQMLAFAIGLMSHPDVLLLDEPSIGLSPKLVHEVFDHIEHMSQERDIAIVVVEHNLKSLHRIADKVYEIEGGKAYIVAGEGA